MSDEPAAMFDAFRRTDFVVHAPGGDIVLRHGRTSSELEALLRPGESWAFMTAWNPGRTVSRSENDEAQLRLRERLRAKRVLEAVGRSADETWAEPSVFVFDCSRDEALSIGRAFGQLAVVVGAHGAPALVTKC